MGGSSREADCCLWKGSSLPGFPTILKWTVSLEVSRRCPGLGVGVGTEEQGPHQKQLDAAFRHPSNISVFHVPVLQAARQNSARASVWPGRAGHPAQGQAAVSAGGLPPTSQAWGSAPRGSPSVPGSGASFSSPAGPTPTPQPSLQLVPPPFRAQRRHWSTLSTGLGSVSTGPSGC